MNQVPFVKGSPLYEPYPNGYDCGDDCLISYLYTYGEAHPDLYPDAEKNGSQPGVEAMRDAVSGLTGLTLQYYVLIDMQGFSELIDSLGGITIDVKTDLKLGKNGEKPLGVIKAGIQKMDGPTALWYARSRYNLKDYERMAHQREVQEAVVAQFDPANVISKFQGIAAAGAQVVKTDVPQDALPYFIELADKTRSLPVTSFDLVPDNGIITAHPDIPAIQQTILATLSASLPTTAP